VTAFLDLSADGEDVKAESYVPFLSPGIELRRSPTEDMSADPSSVKRSIAVLDELLASGKTVYLHCVGGFGRTGTVVGSYLVEKALAAPSEALGLVVALRANTDRPEAQSPQPEAQRLLVSTARPGPSALPL